MVSTATTRNRLEKIGPGEQLNSWGGPNGLNRVIDLIDAMVDGWLTISASGSTTLTSANYVADQARLRIIKYTGSTSGTITIPSVEKWYIVKAVSADVTITTGGGASATVKAGDAAIVICDAANCYKMQSNDFGGAEIVNIATPTTNASATTKAYVDGIAFETTGALPGQNAGTNYNAVFSDGADASWRRTHPQSTSSNAGQVLKSTGTDGFPDTTSLQWSWDAWQGVQFKSANYTVVLTDRGTNILCSNSITLSLTAAATLGSKFYCRLVNVGTDLVTIDPNSSETITVAGGSAKSSIVLIPGEGVDVFCDGSNWVATIAQTAGAGPHYYAYETTGPAYIQTTWTNRVIVTAEVNKLGVTLSGGQLQNVPAGQYRIKFEAFGEGVTSCVGRIYNATTAAEIFHGEVSSAQNFNPSTVMQTTMHGDSAVTLTATSSLNLQTYGTIANASGGSWAGPGVSPLEKSAAIWLTRISP